MKKWLKYIFLFIIIIISVCLFFVNSNCNNIDVLSIKTYNNGLLYKEGNGFVYKVDDYAYILTNYHVISDSDDVYIFFKDDKIKASVLNYDEYDDIAILLVNKDIFNGKVKIGSLNKCDEKSIKIVTSNKSVDGIILNKKEPVKVSYNNTNKMLDLVKIKANIKEGFSGSPVVDENNNVIGIMTMVDKDNRNISYALAIDDVMDKINVLEHSNLFRPNLGISATNSIENVKGVLLNDIFGDYPASEALLKVGDIIVGVDGHQVKDISEFRYYLYKYNKGDVINISYYRDNSYYDTYIKLDK